MPLKDFDYEECPRGFTTAAASLASVGGLQINSPRLFAPELATGHHSWSGPQISHGAVRGVLHLVLIRRRKCICSDQVAFFHKKRSFLVICSQLPAQLYFSDGNQYRMECYPSIWSEDQNAFFEAKLLFWQIAFFFGHLASPSCKHILNEVMAVLTKAHPQLFPSLLSSSLLLSLLSPCQSP